MKSLINIVDKIRLTPKEEYNFVSLLVSGMIEEEIDPEAQIDFKEDVSLFRFSVCAVIHSRNLFKDKIFSFAQWNEVCLFVGLKCMHEAKENIKKYSKIILDKQFLSNN